MKNQISVLIPDGESPVLVYVINCFSKVDNVNVYVISDKKDGYMRYSRYISKYIYFKKSDSVIKWLNFIDLKVEEYNIDVILPIYEQGIRELIKSKNELRFKSKLCALPEINNFNSACDKGLLYKHLKKNNLPSPESVIVKVGDLPEINDIVKFPVIVKPVEGYGGGKGIEILRDRDDLVVYYNKNTFKCDTIIQDFIEGFDVCSNVLCKNGEVIAYSVQKANMYEKGELTYQVGFEFIEDDVLLRLTKLLMKSLNWSGVANIDWRYDLLDESYKVIEINTRYWYNTDASVLAGVNFPYLTCLSSLNKNFEIPKVNLIDYLSLKGLSKQILRKPFMILKTKFLCENTSLIFALRDPFPMIYKLIWRTKNKIFKRFNFK